MKALGLRDLLAGDRVRIGKVGRDDADKPSVPRTAADEAWFSIRLMTGHMAPVYCVGDTVLLRKRRKGEPMKLGSDYLFVRGGGNAPEGRKTCLCRLIDKTGANWIGHRYSPTRRRFLSRRLWRTAFVVVGVYRA